jgi:DNA-binding transcriptional ArsR family regulator
MEGDENFRRVFTQYTLRPEQFPQEEENPNKFKTSWTANELIKTDFPEPKWDIPETLPVGLSFLAGRPKVGKSWLALQIAIAKGTGGYVFGKKVDLGKILYLAFEDSPRRLKNRLKKHNINNANIQFELAWPSLADGGILKIEQAIVQGGYTFIIIDTLSRAVGRSDQLDMIEMTAVIGALHGLTITHDISIMLVDHHRKTLGFNSDPIDDIFGSTGKAAVLDTAIGLYKEQGKAGAILKIVGRDIEEVELSLKFDILTGCWQSLGNADDVKADSVKAEILEAIRTLIDDGELATNNKIAKALTKDRGNISRHLSDLENAGKVRRLDNYGKIKPYILIEEV